VKFNIAKLKKAFDVWLDIKVGNFSSVSELGNRAMRPYRGEENVRKRGQ